MTQTELNKVLEFHEKWLNDETDGKKAILSRAVLHNANLQYADISYATICCTDMSHSNMEGADLSCSDMHSTNLSESNLRETNLYLTNLHGADLRGSDIDYSCLPLWSGGLHMKTDRRIMAQIAYHFCCQDCDDPDYLTARNAILDFANTFHRVDECGKLERIEVEKKDD